MINYYDFVKANPSLFRQFSCKGILALIMNCPPDFERAEEWINHNCFLHVINGNHIFFSRERSWFLSKGATVFIKKGGLGIQRVDEEAFCCLMFFVPDSYIRSFLDDKAGVVANREGTFPSKDILLNVEANEVLFAFFHSVLSYFHSGQEPPEELLELKFRELLFNIITNGANRELNAYLYRVYLSGMDDLRDIMERNYFYKLSLEEYARLCHRSLSKFKRDFGAIFGMPPGKWLLVRRLEYARDLLVNTVKSITDVVLESGFTNVAHFDRVFKKCFNESPLQYRKKFSGLLEIV